MNKDLQDWVNGIVKENYTTGEWEAYNEGYNQCLLDTEATMQKLEEEVARLRKANDELLDKIHNLFRK